MTRRPRSSIMISHLEELNRRLLEMMETEGEVLQSRQWIPPADVLETEGAVVILIEVPGLEADSVAVEIEGKTVTVRGDKRVEAPAGGQGSFRCMERSRGPFSRSFRLTGPVDTAAATARLAGGVLEIELPKLADEGHARKRIPIQADPESGDD